MAVGSERRSHAGLGARSGKRPPGRIPGSWLHAYGMNTLPHKFEPHSRRPSPRGPIANNPGVHPPAPKSRWIDLRQTGHLMPTLFLRSIKGNCASLRFSPYKGTASSGHLLMLIRNHVSQGLNRRMAAGRGAAAPPVAEHFNAIKQIRSGLVSRRVLRAVHPFVVQTVGETLRRRAVPEIFLTAHRSKHAVIAAPAPESRTRIPAGHICLHP